MSNETYANWRTDKKSEAKGQPNKFQYKIKGENGLPGEMKLDKKPQKNNE